MSEFSLDRSDDQRKPRIALLGEFSAGKSTLVNLLMKAEKSPVRVTATQVPPIWYSHGTGQPIHIARDGTETELDSDDLTDLPLDDTRAVRVFVETDILELCDLIDMPGSSDPNMTPDIWDAMLPQADGAIWCSPATQAWRQSEAAIWDEVPPKLHRKSVLLLTRIDKVRSIEDRIRVHTRVHREAGQYFRGIYPVSLLQAQDADDDPDLWREAGMADFSDKLLEIVGEIENGEPEEAEPKEDLTALRQARSGIEPVAEVEDDASASPAMAAAPDAMAETAEAPAPEPEEAPRGPVIVPRRVVSARGRTARPRRTGTEGSLI